MAALYPYTARMRVACVGDSMTNFMYPRLRLMRPAWDISPVISVLTAEELATIFEAEQDDTHNRIVTFCVGHHDPLFTSGVPNGNEANVLAALDRMIACVDKFSDRWLVISRFSADSGPNYYAPNGIYYHAFVAQNQGFLSRYGETHYLDVWDYIVNCYNPSVPQDVIDYGRHVQPASLRLPGDEIHLNNDGSDIFAARIVEKFTINNWAV